MTYRGETVGKRIDSYYYQQEFRTLDQIVDSVQFDVFNLGILINDIASGITPKVDEDYYTDSSGIPFLRVQNVTSQGIDLSDVKFIKREVHEGMLKRAQLKKDDLVFTITGRIGSVAVVPDNFEGNINQHSVRFHLKEQVANININPHYVSVFLNSPLGRSLAIREVTGGTRPALDYKALYSLKIILPPLDIQNHIVEIMQAAYAQKKQKEQEADALLDSIDDYVLSELGVEMPVVEEKKCFVVYAGEIEGRIDPEYNHPKFEAYKEPKSYFAFKRIKELSIDIRTGLPIRQDFRSKDGQYPYYGANGIIGYMDDYTHDGRYLVVGQDGYIGNHYVVEGKFWASNHNWVAKFREDVNLDYVKAFLDAWNYEYLITGGVIPKLTKEAFESISIPMPSFEIQEKIADEAMRQRSKAMKLRQEADAIVEEAKREVERVMLEGVSG